LSHQHHHQQHHHRRFGFINEIMPSTPTKGSSTNTKTNGSKSAKSLIITLKFSSPALKKILT